MAQNDFAIPNQGGQAFRLDVQDALQSLAGHSSGATDPNTAVGTTYPYQFWADTNNSVMKMRNGADSDWIELFQLDGEWSTIAFENGTAAAPSIYFKDSGTDTGFYSPGADQVGISTGGTSALVVDASQRVGIGTASPGRTLDVAGSIRSGGSTNPYLALADGTTEAYFEIASSLTRISSGTSQPLAFRIGSSEAARIDSSARLLVGTSTSTYSNAKLQIAGPASNNYLSLLNTSASDADGNRYSYISFRGLQSGGEESALALIGAMHDGSADDQKGRLIFYTNDGNDDNSPTQRMIIRQDGTTQIFGVYSATTGSAANVNVDVNGYLTRSTSSIKYKTSVETLEDQYADALLQCRPVWYRSLSEKDNPEWGWWGFIAEEVAEIDPRLVHWKTQEVTFDETGSAVTTDLETPEPEGVQYDRFVPHLLNLIKRQKEQIEAMEARLSALEAQ